MTAKNTLHLANAGTSIPKATVWRLLQYGACTSGKGKNCPRDNSQDHTCSPSDDPVGVSLRASDTMHTTSGLSTIVQPSVTTLRNASVFSAQNASEIAVYRAFCAN
jgi:hypothetical protein